MTPWHEFYFTEDQFFLFFVSKNFLILLPRLDTYTKNPTFSVGLQGLHEDDINKVVGIIQETFQKVVQ